MPRSPGLQGPLPSVSSTPASSATAAAAAPAAPLRRFGRFELRGLLSKTPRSLLWLVFDPRNGQELLLAMPREKPASPEALAQWKRLADGGARINHPQLAHVVEQGEVELWPYLAYDRALGETLEERLRRQPAPLPLDVAAWVCQLLEGLAYAHEAGHVHRDLQLAHVLINATDQVRLLGLEVAQEPETSSQDFNTLTRSATREAAAQDVLAVGLMLHRLLSGKPVLDQTDLHQAMALMQPQGRELVRLGWETPHPIPDPLRAIANRSTDRQARQRYHQARTLLRALEGWRTAAAHDAGGPIALLMDKLQRYGHLPASSARLSRILGAAGLEGQHAAALSGLVLDDMALSLELLRRVNNALKQSGAANSGTMLNMQRAIAMIGLNGLQAAVRSLKPWPGPLSELQATVMRSLMKRVHRAGLIAQNLRPAGFDPEVVYLVCLLQNLGRLLLQYHFPDDAQQVRQLMLPPEPTEEAPHPVGMSEQAAAYAVLGCDLDALGSAVARYWGLDEDVQHMMHRASPDAPVRHAGHDTDVIRLTCSFANELVDAMVQPEGRRKHALEMATRRYARVLGLGLRDVMDALKPETARKEAAASHSPEAAREIGSSNLTLTAHLDIPPIVPSNPIGSAETPQPSALRRRLAGGAPDAADAADGSFFVSGKLPERR